MQKKIFVGEKTSLNYIHISMIGHLWNQVFSQFSVIISEQIFFLSYKMKFQIQTWPEAAFN